MAIKYRLVRTRNPKTGQRGLKAAVFVTDRVHREKLVELISAKTTVSSGDVSAVLAELADLLWSELREGRPVSLDGIGTLYVQMYGPMVETPEEFHPARHIRRAAVRFRVSRDLKRMQRNFEFRLFAPEGPAAEEAPAPPPTDEDDGDAA